MSKPATGRSVEVRLRGIIISCATVALILVSLADGIHDTFNEYDARNTYASSLANVMASSATAAVVFSDRDAATEILNSLREEPDVLTAELRDASGPLATYIRKGPTLPAAGTAGAKQGTNIVVEQPIEHDGARVGHLRIEVSMATFYDAVFEQVLSSVLFLLVTILLAAFMANRFAKSIAAPIAELGQTMHAVSLTGDFTLRAQQHVDDEVGALVAGFNHMLDELQDRDQQLTAQREQLEQEVHERTKGLRVVNDQLQHTVVDLEIARDAAEAASEAKGQFLANMSHEIRSPLNGVIGMAELLQRSGLADRQAHFCNTILTSSKALLGIINDILDLSKVEAGSMELEDEAFDLTELVDETVQLFAGGAARKGIELICNQTLGERFVVRGDSLRVRQILINLLSNAVKFTPHGEIEVRAGAQLSDGMAHTEITVRDTGIGMSAEVQARLFESFMQADGSTSRRYGGTGLGLAISQQLTKIMNGTLSVSSEPDQGTTFTFSHTFPHIQHSSVNSSTAMHGIKALVVDERPSSRASTLQLLTAWGARTSSVANAKELMALFANQHANEVCDIILMAADLGGEPAAQVLQRVHQRYADFHLPVILLTTVAALAQPNWRRPPFVVDVVAKPLRRSELFNAIHKVVGRDRHDSSGNIVMSTSIQFFAGNRVLLAEDNLINQEVATEHLRSFGCEVVIAANGAEAARAFDSGTFDAILMDCQMPVVDGYQGTRMIREAEAKRSLPRTPVVALTANALKGDREKCIAAGMDDFLSKPFEVKDLIATLGRWIKPKRTDPQPAPVDDPERLMDSAEWRELMAMDVRSPGVLARIVDAFVQDADRLTFLLGSSGMNRNEVREQLRFQCHRMKSAARTIGAVSLSQSLTQLESAMDGDSDPSVVPLFTAAQRHLATVVAELKQFGTHPITQNAITRNRSGLRRVLIADDDFATRSVVTDWLERDGYEVTAVDDGYPVLSLVAAQEFDLILMDVQMPNCDGYEACRQVRRHANGMHVPIIMLTGSDDTESIQQAYEAGATDFISKPVAEVLLRQRLRYILRAQQANESLRRSETRLQHAQLTARVSYWEWDAQRNTLNLGVGIRTLLGLSLDESQAGLTILREFLSVQDAEFIEQVLAGKVLAPNTRELHLHTRSNEELVVEQTIERLEDENTGKVLWLGTLLDITHRRQAEQRIYRMSYFDALTGLPNLPFLRKSLRTFLRLADRHQTSVGYLVIDVGGHHRTLAALGPDFRDRYVLEMVHRLADHTRGSDLFTSLPDPDALQTLDDNRAAQVAGDRFAIVLNGVTTTEQISRACQRLIESLGGPVTLGPDTIFPHIAIGIAKYPEDGEDFDLLHRNALTALNQIARQSGNGFQWYVAERDAAERARIALERDLRHALEHGQLDVHYQPRLNASTLQPVGMEALVRWHHEGKWISPGAFIPIAEQSGLISSLGTFVLERAISDLAQWNRSGMPELAVSVNVSGEQFVDSDLAQLCTQLLRAHQLPSSQLELEITEGVLIEATGGIMTQLHALKQAGIGLALDDFGTGFSSLAYLSNFPLDVLKIDRAFIDRLPGHRNSEVIVRSTTDLAHELGLRVVAEGVEKDEQLQWLAANDCDELQGYFFSPALPREKFEQWILERVGSARNNPHISGGARPDGHTGQAGR